MTRPGIAPGRDSPGRIVRTLGRRATTSRPSEVALRPSRRRRRDPPSRAAHRICRAPDGTGRRPPRPTAGAKPAETRVVRLGVVEGGIDGRARRRVAAVHVPLRIEVGQVCEEQLHAPGLTGQGIRPPGRAPDLAQRRLHPLPGGAVSAVGAEPGHGPLMAGAVAADTRGDVAVRRAAGRERRDGARRRCRGRRGERRLAGVSATLTTSRWRRCHGRPCAPSMCWRPATCGDAPGRLSRTDTDSPSRPV